MEDGAPPLIASPPTIPAAPPLGASPESSECSKAANWEEEATADLARMIALHGYDPSFVEDSYFRSFVRQLNPDFQVPSRAAIEDICDDVCDEANGVLESELERTSAKVNLAIDTAETALGKVLYAACHFIDEDWNRRLMILEATTVVPKGMGRLSGSGFDKVGEYNFEFSKVWNLIADRVFSTAIETAPHVNHLPVFESVVRYEPPCNVNNVLHKVASCICNGMISDSYAEEAYDATRQERGEFYSQLGVDHPLPYDKQWISFYFSLQLLRRKDLSSPIPKSYELMCNVFGEIYRASKTISDPNRPTSNIVLRELFKVRETLHSSLADASGDESDLYKGDVVNALEEAEKILDRSINKEYLQWSIPVVLDPRYKLEYIIFLFSRAFSSKKKKYIAKIKMEIKELFTSFSIEDGGETIDADPIHESEITSAHQLDQAWGEHRQHSEVTKTELDRYLEGHRVKDTDDFDILNWWKLNSSKYPTLARMARAALAMRASSKLSSEQMSQITSKICGYTKEK